MGSRFKGWIKVCGITRAEDALASARFGAGAVGFVFAESKRRVTPALAGMISKSLSASGFDKVDRVGVYVNSDIERIDEDTRSVPINVVQLHGDESPELCLNLKNRLPGVAVVKAFRIACKEDIRKIRKYRGSVDAVLLDAFSPGAAGGTGLRIPTEFVIAAKTANPELPLVLSGGLNSENIRSAVWDIRPDGVDASSGLEEAPGVKDHARLEAYIKTARRAFHDRREVM